MRLLAPILALALALAPPLHAQRGGDVPRRPRLPAAADTNDARAYYRFGQENLERRPDDAAAAFYWASQIDPGWADPLYGRHVALLMSNPRRLILYQAGDRRTRLSPEALRIDSLYFRALRLDPFVQRPFERELVRMWVMTALTGSNPNADMSLAAFYTETILQDLPPLLRGRVLAGEGRLPQALRAYDEALREGRSRRSETRRHIRHERGRMFALAGNDSAALAELQLAIDAGVEEERDELVRFYDSKAMLEYSRGRILERAGDPAAAREAYARALVEDLAYHPAHMRMAALALVAGDSATAVQELALAVDAGADDAVARLAYAVILATQRRLDEAEAQLLAAIEVAPHYAEPWYVLGLVRDWRGSDQGVEAYRGFLHRARRDDPRRAQVEQVIGAGAPGG
jgi:tetratricopeptide (TPR) repeat protein